MITEPTTPQAPPPSVRRIPHRLVYHKGAVFAEVDPDDCLGILWIPPEEIEECRTRGQIAEMLDN
jgi:hypothetical protein